MRIELNELQLQCLDTESPTPQMVDPRTNTTYFLIHADIFERLQSLLVTLALAPLSGRG